MKQHKENHRILVGARTTIAQRGRRGIWTAEYWKDGKHHRKSLRTTNLRKARQLALELEVSQSGQTADVATQDSTIRDVSCAYLNWLRTEGRRPKTITKNAGLHKIFLQFSEDQKCPLIADITPRHIDRFREIRKLTCSPKTMHNDAIALKSLFRWAEARHYLKVSPMAAMRFRRPIPRPSLGGPTVGQIEAILAAARPRIRPQLAMLAFTGMRSGEMQALRLQDVDLAKGWIHIESREDRPTKTGHGRRVPIHRCLLTHLLAVPKKERPWFFVAAPSKGFPSGDHWVNTKRLNEDLLAILKTLGLPVGRWSGFTTHSLRHSFETTCVNAGIPQRVVDLWLGHCSDRSMGAVYYHLSDEESQTFMARVPFGTAPPTLIKEDQE